MAYIGLSKLYCIQGIYPVAISRIVLPKDHISALKVYLVYFITSGAIHGTEPFRVLLRSSLADKEFNVNSNCLAQPKSDNLTVPSLSTKILAPLISLWIIPFE